MGGMMEGGRNDGRWEEGRVEVGRDDGGWEG